MEEKGFEKISEELLNDSEFQSAIKDLREAMGLLNKELGTNYGVDVAKREYGGLSIKLG